MKKNRITNEITKLNENRTNTIKLYAEDKIVLEAYKEIQNIIEEKLANLNIELNNLKIESKDEIDVENIKEIITNIKNNFMHLTNHERKMFLERFINEIKVIKENDKVKLRKLYFRL